MKTVIKLFPWLVVLILLGIYALQYTIDANSKESPTQVTHHDVILKSVESLGKLELTKYRFKEIVESKQIS